jgi:biotin transport system substrate-specific component
MPRIRKEIAPRPAQAAALVCLNAALSCAGAYISIPLPIGPVPLALGNFFAVLGGLLLGPWRGAASAGLYVLIGALGFPVFSGGRGGLAHIAGPTGGYLAGYIVGAVLAGLPARKRDALGTATGAVLGFAAVLALGATGLRLISGVAWGKSLAVGVLPFLPGDAVKAVLAAVIALRLGPFVDSLTGRPGRLD